MSRNKRGTKKNRSSEHLAELNDVSDIPETDTLLGKTWREDVGVIVSLIGVIISLIFSILSYCHSREANMQSKKANVIATESNDIAKQTNGTANNIAKRVLEIEEKSYKITEESYKTQKDDRSSGRIEEIKEKAEKYFAEENYEEAYKTYKEYKSRVPKNTSGSVKFRTLSNNILSADSNSQDGKKYAQWANELLK